MPRGLRLPVCVSAWQLAIACGCFLAGPLVAYMYWLDWLAALPIDVP